MKLKTTQLLTLLALLSNLLIWPASAGQSHNFDQNFYQNLNESQKHYWLKLLHASDNGKSRIDGEKFFLHPKGKENPDLEFNATVNSFYVENKTVGWFNYPVQCVFRARYEFIKSLELLNDAKVTACPMFEEWKNALNVDSLTMVFSSSYPNNPSSLFGHTLIRLNQKNKKNDLLDYAVAFSAIPDNTDIGFVYAIKGLFGGYKGFVEVTKYYTKVGDYTNSESRDLLEYDLKLTPDEISRFIDHVWEVYQAGYADYYFFDENCSSFLAELLQVAMIDRKGVDHHSRWYYLPAELVKNLLKQENLVGEFHYRPSLKKQLEKRLAHLSDEQLNLLKLARSNGTIKNLDLDLDTLDSLISTLEYRRNSSKNNLNESDKTLFRESLIKRSKDKSETKVFTDYNVTNRPETGHESKTLAVYSTYENINRESIGFTFNNGYHGLMDKDLGFDPFSQFEFLGFDFAYNFKLKKLYLDKFNFVNLTSVHPFKFYDPQMSWNATVSYERFYLINNDFQYTANAKMTGGLSFKLTPDFVYNLFGGAFVELNKNVKKGYRIGPAFDSFFLYSFHDQFKLGLFHELKLAANNKLKDDYQLNTGVKFSTFFNKDDFLHLEYKMISRFGKLDNYFNQWKVSYDHHF